MTIALVDLQMAYFQGWERRKEAGGRNRPFMLLISSELCTNRQSNQANPATAQSNPLNTLWYPFWCPSLVGRFSTLAPRRNSVLIIAAHNNDYYCIPVRREIGKEQRVKVSNREGIANQTGPKSCVVHREVRDEALIGGACRPAIEIR
jgi:hypothetical protein